MSESSVKRISTRGSGAKKGPQKYQNTVAYKHNKNSKKTRAINALPISGLCQRCHDVLEWRKKFRKYKPLTTAKKWYSDCSLSIPYTFSDILSLNSVCCGQKSVKEAYHVLCNKCADDKKVCAKCQESKQILPSTVKDEKVLMAERLQEERLLASMSERERRSYLRKAERGEDSDEESNDDESLGEEDEEEEEEEKRRGGGGGRRGSGEEN
ncbi:hypothetical protein K493DRAFT_302945 [Basidiobolus meristosporus CBS 931.73]|uniref:Uncharacterized protein n=1 Tax=Basidiobolus meristosporus CBS 931.73 TaxID=1314790 RepID=A0A1Y1Y644_9FUNG|nr:hypothetical protein K493DRAFT_302945 [Basidiobolus meristosporus CBS 931.73]|eukprot:ORX93054.1 hypothetical protein K493DRAFT_302945 [Basidiobolus meristosporus CBS 931.73]